MSENQAQNEAAEGLANRPMVDFSLIGPACSLTLRSYSIWIPALLLVGLINLCLSSPIYYAFKIAGWEPKDSGIPDIAVIAVIQVILFPLSLTFGAVTAGLYNLSLKQVEGLKPSVLEIFNFRGQFIQLVIVFFLINVAVAVGVILGFVPGLIVNALFSLAPLLVLERGLNALAALRLSWQT